MSSIRAASSSAAWQLYTKFAWPLQLRRVPKFRSGRCLRNNAKPKHVVSMERFLCRSAGTFGTSHDETLQSLGLADVIPSHHHRHLSQVVLSELLLCPCQDIFIKNNVFSVGRLNFEHPRLASDFLYRYWQKSATELHKARFLHSSVTGLTSPEVQFCQLLSTLYFNSLSPETARHETPRVTARISVDRNFGRWNS